MKIFTLFIVLFALACFSYASEISGQVIVISDGDTIHLLTGGKKDVKIRLNKIDAPEKNQAFGQQSKKSLSDMIYMKQVIVSYKEIDRYGRILGTIYFDGLDINLEQVKKGMAWVYRKYTKDMDYIHAEEMARRTKKGLWVDTNPIEPENFRHKAKETVSTQIKIKQDSYFCGAKRFCAEMKSCEEAKFYLNKCGLFSLDRDGDGMPCESLCQ